MAKQEETQTMEEYLLSQLDTPVVPTSTHRSAPTWTIRT